MRTPSRLGSGLTLCGVLGLLVLSGCPSGDKTKRIIILNNGNSPYWDACRAGLKEAEKDLELEKEGLRAVFVDNNGKPEGQIDNLRQFASQSDVAAVGLVAIDASNIAIVDEMRALRKKGVHLITIDSDIDRDKFRDARFAYLGTDNFVGGVELGKCIKNLSPTGSQYVTFVGRTGAQNAIDRIGGVAKGAGDGAKSLDSMQDENKPDRAKENVRNAMINHPGLNTLVGIWSYNAPAIVDIVKEKDARQKYTIVVFDAEPLTIEAMGNGMIDAMVVQNPYGMGYQGVKLMKAMIKNDQATIKAMLPRLDSKENDADIIDTGIKVIVPDKGSTLKADMFDKSTEFLKLSDFREWMAKYKLTAS